MPWKFYIYSYYKRVHNWVGIYEYRYKKVQFLTAKKQLWEPYWLVDIRFILEEDHKFAGPKPTAWGLIIESTNSIHEARLSHASEPIYKKQQYLNIIINSSHTGVMLSWWAYSTQFSISHDIENYFWERYFATNAQSRQRVLAIKWS